MLAWIKRFLVREEKPLSPSEVFKQRMEERRDQCVQGIKHYDSLEKLVKDNMGKIYIITELNDGSWTASGPSWARKDLTTQ